uniref:hypothetical protein n=1 Tax=Levilactobacillus andaensis TaxID=2799570 RepID=UPI0019437A1D
ARRLVFFQAEASPQQAESLAAAVRPMYINLAVSTRANTGMKQTSHLSTFSERVKISLAEFGRTATAKTRF